VKANGKNSKTTVKNVATRNNNVERYTYNTERGKITLTPETVIRYLNPGGAKLTPQEIMMFISLCKYQQLNPFLREAYLIKYGSSEPAQMVVGKDVFIQRASNDPRFKGMKSGVILFNKIGDLEEREGSFVLPDETIVGGWATGYRGDWDYPKTVKVSLEEYAGRKKDGSFNRQWASKTGTMIEKVAVSQMLRALIPEKLVGLYGTEEMGVDSSLPETPIEVNVTETVKNEIPKEPVEEEPSKEPIASEELEPEKAGMALF